MRSNCLIFALSKFLRNGGYLIIKKSDYGPWFHFMWSENIDGVEIEHFVPQKHKKSVAAFFHKWWFKGNIKNEKV